MRERMSSRLRSRLDQELVRGVELTGRAHVQDDTVLALAREVDLRRPSADALDWCVISVLEDVPADALNAPINRGVDLVDHLVDRVFNGLVGEHALEAFSRCRRLADGHVRQLALRVVPLTALGLGAGHLHAHRVLTCGRYW